MAYTAHDRYVFKDGFVRDRKDNNQFIWNAIVVTDHYKYYDTGEDVTVEITDYADLKLKAREKDIAVFALVDTSSGVCVRMY